MKQQWIWAAAGLALVVLIVLLIVRSSPEEPVEPAPEPVADALAPEAEPEAEPPPPPPEPEPEETADVPEEPAGPPLPSLEESDPEALLVLGQAFGEEAVARLLVASGVIPKIVVTVDNLPREKISMRLRALRSAPGLFEPGGTMDRPMLTPANYPRYAPYIELISATDANAVLALYARYYPLLQQAYEELGYPDQAFHDRVLVVIDDLLAAPEIDRPLTLSRPHVLYRYADPNLEALSAGQKMLIRMGADNARAVKARLREIRSLLADWTPPAPGVTAPDGQDESEEESAEPALEVGDG
jgi:hypothetical protein